MQEKLKAIWMKKSIKVKLLNIPPKIGFKA